MKWRKKIERDGRESMAISFSEHDCATCELRERCTDGKYGRTLSVSEHYERVERRRAEAKTEEFKEKLKSRAAIEGTLSELVRKHGFRRHRYRGEAKRCLENMLKAATCNLKRLAKALIARWEQEKSAVANAEEEQLRLSLSCQ